MFLGTNLLIFSIGISLILNNCIRHCQRRQMALTALVIGRMAVVMSVCSTSDSLFKINFLTNKLLVAAIAGMSVLQLTAVHAPFMNPIFSTAPLTMQELALTLALASVVLFVVEIDKWWKRRKAKRNQGLMV